MSAAFTSVYDIDSGVPSFPNDDGTRELGQKAVADARKACCRFLRDGVVRAALLNGAIHLAQLDTACCSGFVYENEKPRGGSDGGRAWPAQPDLYRPLGHLPH